MRLISVKFHRVNKCSTSVGVSQCPIGIGYGCVHQTECVLLIGYASFKKNKT